LPLNQTVPGRRFPAALERAVMHGLERDPSQRQPTVTAFADELVAGLSGGGLSKAGLLDRLKRVIGREGS
jgi:hypothetical protein